MVRPVGSLLSAVSSFELTCCTAQLACTLSIQEFENQPYLFGYAFFRQRKDASISRGYFQKSVVLVSHLPFVELFEQGTQTLRVGCWLSRVCMDLTPC